MSEASTRFPGAEIFALAHARFVDESRDAGAAHVIPYRSARLGVLPLLLTVLPRLRRLQFAAVVVPQMTSDARSAANLYRLAAAIGAPATIVLAGDAPASVYRRTSLWRLAARATLLHGPDVAYTVWLQLRGLVSRRRSLAARRPGPRRILHVVDNLGIGGAQVQLAELVNGMPAEDAIDIVALSGLDDFSRPFLSRPGGRVTTLDVALSNAERILAIADRCRRHDYDIVHTWLFHANLAGCTGARLAGVPRVVASIRSLSPAHYPAQRLWWHRAADCLTSRLADAVTVNAAPLAADHAAWARLPARRVHVVHNGFDLSRLEPADGHARRRLRQELGVSDDRMLVGTVGRLAPEKDQATFLRMLAELDSSAPRILGVIAGDGPERGPLIALAAELGLGDTRLRWLGARPDARAVIAGLDVFVLSSRIEGFPNALLEAVLVGVPAVSSRVGGVPEVFGDDEGQFEPGDHAGAADLVRRALAGGMPTRARLSRACGRFSASALVRRWEGVYDVGCRAHAGHVWREADHQAPTPRQAVNGGGAAR